MPQTIFSADLNDFCQNFLVIRPGKPDPTPAQFDAAMGAVRKSVFENLLLFDKLALKITAESIPVSVLIVVRHGFETPGCACSGGQG